MKKMFRFLLFSIAALAFGPVCLIAEGYDAQASDDDFENYWADDGEEDWDMEYPSDDLSLDAPAGMEESAEDDYTDSNVMFDQEADYSDENFDYSEEDLGDEGSPEDSEDQAAEDGGVGNLDLE